MQNHKPQNNPRISIVVPIYGVEKYLRQCVDSILAQTLKEIEVILVDDGSPDACPQIIDEYAARDARVVAVHQENGGVGPARNKGISLARGEYIAFMDPDDLYPRKESLANLYDAASTSNCDIVGGKLFLFKDGDIIQNGWEISPHTIFPHFGVVDYKTFQSPYAFSCYIYKRTFLLKNKLIFPPLKRFEDPVFFVQAMLAAGIFFAIYDYSYAYRVDCRTIDWLGNHAQKLSDHLLGTTTILKMANERKMRRLVKIIAMDVINLLMGLNNEASKELQADVKANFLNEAKLLLDSRRYRKLKQLLNVGFWGFLGKFWKLR